MDSGYSKWRKLDNAALAFPLVTGKDDTRVFRFYCELKEPVEEATLQAALDETMKRYPLFQAVLRKGLFWFYLERREIRPVVHPEKKPPCSRLYIPDKKSLLFEVSYYQNRINFEAVSYTHLDVYKRQLNNCYTEASPYPSVKENGTDYLLTAVKMEDYLKLYESGPKDRKNPYFSPLQEQEDVYKRQMIKYAIVVILTFFSPGYNGKMKYAKTF